MSEATENQAATEDKQAEQLPVTPKDEFGIPLLVSIPDMQAKIEHINFATLPETNLTICYVKTKSGNVIVGKANFTDSKTAEINPDLGNKISYEDALAQMMNLEIYALNEVRAYAQAQAAKASK